MRAIRFVSRILVGTVFAFSGFVKCVDPVGSALKFSDYFIAFGMDALEAASFPLAFLLPALEFVVGLALIFNARIRFSAWMALLFMLFFTPLTLYLAFTNPVTDCGCFGDALVLSNWVTFWKNVGILALSLIVFWGRKRAPGQSPGWQQNTLVLFSASVAVYILVHSYLHLPIIDFRPYHIGANISDGMAIPEDASLDEYRTILKYEKNGVVKEFDETNYPWQDSTWTFVETTQIKIREGYFPPIHDFSISNELEGDITDNILSDDVYTFLLISDDITEMNRSSLPKIKDLALFSHQNDIKFIGLTASSRDQIEDFETENGTLLEFYNTDETQLKTIIRSNPGLILLKKGTIYDKWHFRDFPAAHDLRGDLAAYSITKHQKLNNKLLIISIISSLLLFVSLFWLITNAREKNEYL